MDARAYLTGLGWRGEGNSLDKEDRGIKKPLLISHKRDLLGLGKKKAAQNVSDQWWLRAFDESLKTIGTGKEVCDIPFFLWNAFSNLSNGRARSVKLASSASTEAASTVSL